jgi:hypothetical protein
MHASPRASVRALALAVVLLGAGPQGALAALTPSGVHVSAQPAFVRVVVDFTGGAVDLTNVQATDPKPADGFARVEVTHPGISVSRLDSTGSGVRALVTLDGAKTARIQLVQTPGKFKYVRITAQPKTKPVRLVIDLYRTAPPSSKAEIRSGVDGCLSLTSVQGSGTSFSVAGTETNVHEGSFVIRVRDATGKVVGTKFVTARGVWSQSLSYDVEQAQSGTIEAVAASAKDGSLACLVQLRVALRAPS